MTMTEDAAVMVGTGRGILDVEESASTLQPDRVLHYREMLLGTPELGRGVSAVVLCREALDQVLGDGRAVPAALADDGVLPGIRGDLGSEPLAGTSAEPVTRGLDGLRERLVRCARGGARFATWRAVFTIGDGLPSHRARHANAHLLARFASLAQEIGVVPVVEIAMRMDDDQSMSRRATAMLATMLEIFDELREFEVDLGGVVLRSGMVLPGRRARELASPDEIARATVTTLQTAVPPEVAGVAFRPEHQNADGAIACIGAVRGLPTPWPVTFSFGEILTDPVLAAWRGAPGRAGIGRRELTHQLDRATRALRTVDAARTGGSVR